MKSLIVVAASVFFVQTAAHAQGLLSTTVAAVAVGKNLSGALPLQTVQAQRADFASSVVINGASVVVQLDQSLVFIDPVGSQEQYKRFGRPDIVVLTRAHPDHLSVETMIGMLRRDTVVLAPQSIINLLPLMIANNVITPFEAGMTQVVGGITFRALPAAATIPPEAQLYPRARGDVGVVVEFNGQSAFF